MGIESRYITRSIRSFYLKRVRGPLTYIAILVIVWIIFPMGSLLFPREVSDGSQISESFRNRQIYVRAKFGDLYFTGLRQFFLGRTTGYYYYTMWDGECYIILLDPITSEQGDPHISGLDTRVCITREGHIRSEIIARLAEQLEWKADAMSSSVSELVLSEPDAAGWKAWLLMVFYVGSAAYAVLMAILYFLYIAFPVLSPPVRRLSAYGKAKVLLAQAEEELSSLPQLATDDMYITQNFFIEVSTGGIALIPIDRIIWIYKYSTLHKLLWHHFSISYTLHITGEKRLYIHCPKNTKTDIDGIIDYLSEANHSILVGFSEENRRKVEVLQGEGEFARKIWAFLSRRV